MATDDKMDMSLADIIKQDRQQQRVVGVGKGRGPGGRGSTGSGPGGVHHFGGPTRGGFGGPGPVRYRGRGRALPHGRPKVHHRHEDFKASAGGSGGGGGWTSRDGGVETGGKLLVSNLPWDVSDADIMNLFSDVGRVQKAAVLSRHGKSIGVADVHFELKEDALNAMRKYDRWTLDGRPMHIQFVDPQFERQRRPPKQGGGMRWNRFSSFEGVQNMPRSQRRRSQWPQQGLSKKRLDAQLDAYNNDMMDTS